MQTVFSSFDSGKCKRMLDQVKDKQRILKLEEQIDSERIIRQSLEHEAKLLVAQIQLIKNKRKVEDKYRGTSLPKYYPNDSPYKERALIRNTLMSTAYKDFS